VSIIRNPSFTAFKEPNNPFTTTLSIGSYLKVTASHGQRPLRTVKTQKNIPTKTLPPFLQANPKHMPSPKKEKALASTEK
jgi:hypothetical protein